MYVIKYSPSTSKKRDCGYTYVLIVEKLCWSKVEGGIHQGGENKIA